MGTPENLQPKPAEWKLAMAEYDTERLGLEILWEYIAIGLEIEGINLEKYKALLIKHGSRPYRPLGQEIIRVCYPGLNRYSRFKLDWRSKIDEPDDEFGPFNPKERANPWNYDAISIAKLVLDKMWEWVNELHIGEWKTFGNEVIEKISDEAFKYHYEDYGILLRPPMKGEYNWGNDMIELLGPFMGSTWNRWYIKQDGVNLRVYKSKYDHGWDCRDHSWIKKMFG